jgi:iron complex transport system permease protein
MSRRALLYSVLFGLMAAVVAWISTALTSREGTVIFDADWPRWLLDASSLHGRVLLEMRAPRVAAGLLTGACLALSGLVLQGVTRNPLADPYLLGVSGGAGVAVVLLHAWPALVQRAGWWTLPVAGFAGAQGATLLVLLLARGGAGRLTVLGLILAGIVINAFCAALMTLALARFDPFRLRVTTTWLAGGFGFVSWLHLVLVAVLLVGAWLFLRAQSHRLNAFALGPTGAATVGVDVNRLLLRSTMVSSLLTGLGVSLGGLLGYVGLMVPHGIRLLVGGDFRSTLPVTATAGALLLCASDAAARLLWAPEEIPLGVITAILGCPVLLWLLRAQLRGRA